MNIKPLTSTRAWKSEPRQNSFAFFACEQCCKKGPRRACFHSCYSRANSSQKKLILPTHEYEMPEKNTGERLPDSMTHFCGHQTQLRQPVKPTANVLFLLSVYTPMRYSSHMPRGSCLTLRTSYVRDLSAVSLLTFIVWAVHTWHFVSLDLQRDNWKKSVAVLRSSAWI